MVDAYFHSMRMTCPIHPGPFFRAAPNWGRPAKHSLPRNLSKRTDVLHSRSITTPWGKPFNLWTSWVYSLRPRVPSWIWIRCIQSATHRYTFKSPPNFAMSTATRNFAQTPSHFIPGQHFLETFTFLSNNNQDHSFVGDYIIPVLNQQTQPLLHLWRPYLTQTFNNALTVTMHISLWHLVAKMPSQLHNSFLPSFIPTRFRQPLKTS